MLRPLRIVAASICAVLAGPAVAAEQWLAYQTADDDGNVTGQLRFGVPETGAVTVDATCTASPPAKIRVALYIPTGAIVAGDPADVRFVTPGHREQSRPGAVVEDAFGTHAVVELAPDDAVWTRLADALTSSIGVTGTRSVAVDLTGSRDAIRQFLQGCAALPLPPPPEADAPQPPPASDGSASDETPTGDTADTDTDTPADADGSATDETADQGDVATPASDDTADDADASDSADSDAAESQTEDPDGAAASDIPLPTAPEEPHAPPPTYPLYVTGPEPLPAYSAVRFGIALDPIPPGTVLLRTGGTFSREGIEWVEVTTQDDRGRTVWIKRETLEPPVNPSAAWRNPSADANLLIREAPEPTAVIVGTIPPLAIGIEDLGVRQGDWAQVRYAEVTGWVSYIYLQPYGPDGPLDLTGRAPADDTPTRPTPAQPYTATHGAWTVDCQPCLDPANGPTCRLTTASTATLNRRATLELAPATDDGTTADLQLRYAVDASVPGPDNASLTYALDAAAAMSVAAEGWGLDPDTGDILLPNATVSPLLGPLGGGTSLTFTVSDGARNWVDQFVLTGLTLSIADLSARLPLPSQFGDQDACPVEEDDETDDGSAASADDQETGDNDAVSDTPTSEN